MLCSLLDKQHYTWNVDAAGAVSSLDALTRLDWCIINFWF